MGRQHDTIAAASRATYMTPTGHPGGMILEDMQMFRVYDLRVLVSRNCTGDRGHS